MNPGARRVKVTMTMTMTMMMTWSPLPLLVVHIWVDPRSFESISLARLIAKRHRGSAFPGPMAPTKARPRRRTECSVRVAIPGGNRWASYILRSFRRKLAGGFFVGSRRVRLASPRARAAARRSDRRKARRATRCWPLPPAPDPRTLSCGSPASTTPTAARMRLPRRPSHPDRR